MNTYTYDIVSNNIAVIRYANENDEEENIFDSLETLEQQLENEGFELEYKC